MLVSGISNVSFKGVKEINDAYDKYGSGSPSDMNARNLAQYVTKIEPVDTWEFGPHISADDMLTTTGLNDILNGMPNRQLADAFKADLSNSQAMIYAKKNGWFDHKPIEKPATVAKPHEGSYYADLTDEDFANDNY